MTLPLLAAIPAIGSAIGLPLLDTLRPPDFPASVREAAGQFATGVGAVLTSVDIVRVAYVTCLLVGVLLYFTHVGRRLGKDLVVGGVGGVPRLGEVVSQEGDYPSERGDLLARLEGGV